MFSVITLLKFTLLFSIIHNITSFDYHHTDTDYLLPIIQPDHYFNNTANLIRLSNDIEDLLTVFNSTFGAITDKILCFPEKTIKEFPSLAILCIILSLVWLWLTMTLCLINLRNIFEQILNIIDINGQRLNRENPVVNRNRAQILPRLLLFKQDAKHCEVSRGDDSK